MTNSIKCVGGRLLQTLLALITNVLEQYWCNITLAEICRQLISTNLWEMSVCGAFFYSWSNSLLLTFTWNLICNLIKAVTLRTRYFWCDFISLHWSIRCAAYNLNWTHSAAAECTKMLTQSNNGAICTDWWKPSVRGARKRALVSLWVSWQSVRGSCTVRVRAPVTWQPSSDGLTVCVSSVWR